MASPQPASEKKPPASAGPAKQPAPAEGKGAKEDAGKGVQRAAEPAKDNAKGAAPGGAKAPAPANAKTGAADKSAGAGAKTGGADKSAGAAKDAGGAAAGGAAPQATQRLDRMAVRAKLEVSEPGDSVEREADETADRVMRMPETPKAEGAKPAGPSAAAPGGAPAGKADAKPPATKPDTPVARAPAAEPSSQGAAKPEQKPKAEEPAAPAIKRAGNSPADHGRPTVPADFGKKIGEGAPLDPQTRSFFEQRFGCDLSHVRIHADDQANAAAQQIHARAFTYGNHIVFAAGQFQPESAAGKRLLAHEITHVIQQRSESVPRMVMRKGDPAAGSGGDLPVKGVTIPAFKFKSYAGQTFTRPGGYSRKKEGSKQMSTWLKNTKGAKDGLAGAFGMAVEDVYAAVPKETALDPGNPDLLVGTPSEIGDVARKPRWDDSGKPTRYDVDHIIELQIGGPSQDVASNLELRDSPSNQSSGSSIDSSIGGLLKAMKDKEDGDAEKIKVKYNLVFSDFKQGAAGGKSSSWTLDDVNKQEPAKKGLKIYGPDLSAAAGSVQPWPPGKDKKPFFGAPDLFVLYPSKSGGAPKQIELDAQQKPKNKNVLAEGWIPGIKMSGFDLNLSGGGDNAGTIKAQIDVAQLESASGGNTIEFTIKRMSGNKKQMGFINTTGALNKIKRAFAVTPLSPVVIDELELMPGTGLMITGTINPTLGLIKGVVLDLVVQGKDLRVEKTIVGDEVKLPGPFKITSSSLTLALGSESGITVTGAVFFAITGLGEGNLKGVGKTDGFAIRGEFQFDKKLFEGEATLRASYVKQGEAGKFSGETDLKIGNKIKGIKGATLHATIDNEKFEATGTADTEVPGLQTITLNLKFQDGSHFSIEAEADLNGKFPGVKSGHVKLLLQNAADKWSFEGKGEVEPDLPLADGGSSGAKVTVTYKEGVFDGKLALPFKQGAYLSGSINVGVTNGAVSPDGELLGSKGGKGDKLSLYGSGRLDVTLEKIKGGIGVKVKPTGRLLIDGDIGIANAITVFQRYPEKDDPIELFSVPTLSIPLVGLAVAGKTVGLALEVSGSVTGYAYAGPGELTEAKIGISNFDPKVPETLHVTGKAFFGVQAAAGVKATISMGAVVGAAVIKAEAKLDASAAVEAATTKDTGISLNVDWTPAAGLNLATKLKATLQPRLKFTLGGHAQIEADAYVRKFQLWRKDWTIAQKELGGNLKLGIQVPVSYSSKTNKVDFDPHKVHFDVPTLDRSTFDALLNKEGSDQVQLPPPAEAGDEGVGGVCEMPSDHEPNQSVMPPQQSSSKPVKRKAEHGEHAGTAGAPTSRGNAASGATDVPALSEAEIAALGPGQPLDLAIRGFFEQRMGTNFATVRIHIGPAADRAAKRISARAFTVGQDIVFAAGQYDPQSEAGKTLLAHELAHVQQQQSGVTRVVMRQGHEATAPTGGDRVAAVRRELESLEVPASKRRHGHVYTQWLGQTKLKHGPNYDRETHPPAQVANWIGAVGNLSSLATRLGELGLTPALATAKSLRFRGGHVETRTYTEWLEYFKVPQWDRQGTWLGNRMEVDHIVELQCAGWPGASEGDTVQNYELLDKSTNASSGSTMYNGLVRKMRTLLEAERNVGPGTVPRDEARTELRSRGVPFRNVVGGGGRGDANSKYFTLEDVRGGVHLENIGVQGNAGEAGSTTSFALMSGPGGIVVGSYAKSATDARIKVDGPLARRMAGMNITQIQLNPSYAQARPNDPIGSVAGNWVLPPGFTPQNAPFSLSLLSVSQYSGYVQPPASFSVESPGLSPVAFDQMSIDGASVSARGQLHPSVPMLARVPIDVRWYNGEIEYGKVFTAADLDLSLPGFTIDAASIGVFFGRSGFNAEGGVDFTVSHLGTGSLTAGVDSRGRFSAQGHLDVDTSIFDRANLTLWYRDNAFGGSGNLAITRPNRVRGVRSASVTVLVDGSRISAHGELQPTIPGVQQAALSAEYGPEQGLTVAGDLRLQSIPGIREGTVHAQLQQRGEGQWKLGATGTAVPNLPGIDSTIAITYDDGLFTGEFNGEYQRSIFSGQVMVGVTNRAVTPDGQLSGTDPGERLVIYGSGALTARLTDHLQGGVGLKVRPAGDILISGHIGIPDAVTIFEQYPPPDRATRELFHMPTVSIPLFGFAVGGNTVGIALTINGRVTGHAFVGPGLLTQAEINVIDFNPARPESLHITGRARFSLPAEAGVDASLDAGVSAGAAVIRVTAGLNVTAGALVRAEIAPSVDLGWTPATGLHLHADLHSSLSPRLRFGVNGYAEVVADAFVTSFTLWRKDWKLAQREIGSNLALGLNVPVDYYSDGRGVVFDPNRVTFQVPELNADTLKQLFDEPAGEQVERPQPKEAHA